MKSIKSLLAALVCAVTHNAQAGRQPIPYPGDRCPPTYHTEQVNRTGGGFSGSIGGGYGPINGEFRYSAPQYQQSYQYCMPNENRNMGNTPQPYYQPAPMPRFYGYEYGPPGPMANSTQTYRYPIYR